jgi:hypothetical protein
VTRPGVIGQRSGDRRSAPFDTVVLENTDQGGADHDRVADGLARLASRS